MARRSRRAAEGARRAMRAEGSGWKRGSGRGARALPGVVAARGLAVGREEEDRRDEGVAGEGVLASQVERGGARHEEVLPLRGCGRGEQG